MSAEKQKGFARGAFTIAAILLLTLTSFDLAFPQFCAEDAATASSDFGPGAPGNPTAPDPDDCFCCCTHVSAASTVSSSTTLQLASDSRSDLSESAPLARSIHIFRPPRLA